MTLEVGPQRDSARKSYEKPVWDTALPLWYRQRAATDVNWTANIEELLQDAQVGDMFIDMSPTEFQVDIKERKKWAFGWHSFIRLHQLVKENGEEFIVSKAIRNYLDLPEQLTLFKTFYGTDVHPYHLLGTVAKVPLGVNAGHIKKMADDLYEATPADRKIIPEGDEVSKEEAEMNNNLKNWQPWLERIFAMMKQGVSPHIIEKEFHGWEMAIKDAVKGETVYIPSLGGFDPQNFSIIDLSIVRHYTSQEYAPVGGSCGTGSGIKKRNPWGLPNIVMTDDLMTYESMSDDIEEELSTESNFCKPCGKENTDDHYHCPTPEGCGKKYASERDKPASQRTKVCSGTKNGKPCGFEFGC